MKSARNVSNIYKGGSWIVFLVFSSITKVREDEEIELVIAQSRRYHESQRRAASCLAIYVLILIWFRWAGSSFVFLSLSSLSLSTYISFSRVYPEFITIFAFFQDQNTILLSSLLSRFTCIRGRSEGGRRGQTALDERMAGPGRRIWRKSGVVDMS
jgi:hypothetical protein